MTGFRPSQLPLEVDASLKRQVRSQFAALPFRLGDNGIEVLLVTSRNTKRWILPKGWPEDGMTPASSAAKEAYEEGGVTGKVYDLCLGVFSFSKLTREEVIVPCVGLVYPLKVKKVHSGYPEKKERRRKWFSPKKAAGLVHQPELKQIIKSFDPAWVKRRKS